jgi:membrane protein implicated in regulation of membrane protease activity
MEKDEKWFTQSQPWARPLIKNWKGAAAGLVFVIAFFTLVAFFVSLEPFTPIDYGLLALWWLSILALMLVFHLFARTKTERRWQMPGNSRRTP